MSGDFFKMISKTFRFLSGAQLIRSGPLKKGLVLFGVLLITFICFYPSLHNGFTSWDDEAHYLENPDVIASDGPHIFQIFKHKVNETYIPLTTLSYALERDRKSVV